jgi:hypothetical protein
MVMMGLLVASGAQLAWAQTAKSETKAEAKTEAKAVSPDQLQWGKAPPGLPNGVEAAVIEGDPTQAGWYTVRLRLPDGTQIRPHWHSKDERITVISGRFGVGMGDTFVTQQMKELPPGGYAAMPARHHHFAAAHGETIVQVTAEGPFDIHYINPSDDPRKQRSSR